MRNMEIWDRVKRPPPSALKQIGGGRLKGMTDISPQWRYQAATEIFGHCGNGWKYTIDKMWDAAGTDGQVAVFAQVSLYVKLASEPGGWSDPIYGVGGSMFIAKETAGLKTSDEAYKMAITDALSVCFKLLGFGAEIYMGLWDGSKYKSADVQPIVKIDPKAKDEFAAQVRSALSAGDDAEIQKLWAEWDTDEKAVLWGLFNSQERTTMKAMKAA